MGATNNIKEVLQDYLIERRVCQLCSDFLTPDNYHLFYRTNHATDWTNFTIGTSRGWISIEIELEHLECPGNKNHVKN